MHRAKVSNEGINIHTFRKFTFPKPLKAKRALETNLVLKSSDLSQDELIIVTEGEMFHKILFVVTNEVITWASVL